MAEELPADLQVILHERNTQVKVAKATNISQRHLSEIGMEKGKRPIGKETAKKLAEVLHIDYRVCL